MPFDRQEIKMSDSESETCAQTIDAELLSSRKRPASTEEIQEEQQEGQVPLKRKPFTVFLPEGLLVRCDELGASWLKHRHPFTAVAFSPDSEYVYLAAKDGLLVKIDRDTGKAAGHFKITCSKGSRKAQKQAKVCASYSAVALNPSGRFLVAGGRDHGIHVWDTTTCAYLTKLTHHRQPVASLSFRKIMPENILYSCAGDKLIKLWDLDQLAYLDTLHGPSDAPQAVDALTKERCLVVSGRDRAARLFKIVTETQLVFSSPDDAEDGSLDSCVLLNEDYFLTGSERGYLTLWFVGKKRPLFRQKLFQGITCVTALRYSDIIAVGGFDEYGESVVSFFKVSLSTSAVNVVPVATHTFPKNCFVVSMDFSNYMDVKSYGDVRLAVATSKEPRLGRWKSFERDANSLFVLSFVGHDPSLNQDSDTPALLVRPKLDEHLGSSEDDDSIALQSDPSVFASDDE